MNIFKIIILTTFIAIQINGQQSNEPLATIGNKTITVKEFKNRYELTPQINRKNDKNKSKEEFLYTLIAEKLLALEAEKNGFDTLDVLKNNLIPLKKMYVRDALYKKEIKDSVKFNNKDFNRGMKLASYKLFVDYLYTKDKSKIDSAYNKLMAIQKFDSLAPLLNGIEYVKNPYEVTFGTLFPKPEREVYNLNIGEFTKPQQSPDGWYIFRLLSKIPATFNNTQEKSSKVKKVVESRIEDSIYNNFWIKFFKKKLINTNGSLFWYFTDNLTEVIKKVKKEQNIKDNNKITLAAEDFFYFKSKLNPDSLKKSFIKFDSNPLTLEDFLNDFMFEGFYTFTTDKNIISRQLQSRVKRQIELELLTRYAEKKGYNNLPDVKSDIEIWRDNYLSTLYKKDFVNNTKLTEKDIKDYLIKNNKLTGTKYKIIEILTDSLDIVNKALTISNNNNLLRNFAKKHSKRAGSKINNGEIGYFNATEYDEIGKVVESMNIGDVYGPLKTNEGFSIFKLIDKKEDNYSITDSTLSNEVRNELRYKKIINDLENKTSKLANKYKVKIKDDLLNSLQVLNTQMIVFRYMGFGGRILAFPYNSPFYKWKDKWEQKKKDSL